MQTDKAFATTAVDVWPTKIRISLAIAVVNLAAAPAAGYAQAQQETPAERLAACVAMTD